MKYLDSAHSFVIALSSEHLALEVAISLENGDLIARSGSHSTSLLLALGCMSASL